MRMTVMKVDEPLSIVLLKDDTNSDADEREVAVLEPVVTLLDCDEASDVELLPAS